MFMKKLLLLCNLIFFVFVNSWFVNCDAAIDRQVLFQTPATKIMAGIIDLHNDIFSVMIILACIVLYLTLQLIIKFSAKKGITKSNFNFTHHTILEVLWTVIPIVILFVFIVPSFVLLYSIDEVFDSELTLKVMGSQWYWSYEYSVRADLYDLVYHTDTFDSYLMPESDLPFGSLRLLEVDNRVKLPFFDHISVLITASDVLHSWAMPSFGVKMDACPGRLNQLDLYINRLGVFFGQCSEICGMNHGFMPMVVESLHFHDFVKWLVQNFDFYY